MLVLSRKLGQQIRIGENVTVTIVKTQGKTVRIGIEAPKDIRVVRAELPPLDEQSGSPRRWTMQAMHQRVATVSAPPVPQGEEDAQRGAAVSDAPRPGIRVPAADRKAAPTDRQTSVALNL